MSLQDFQDLGNEILIYKPPHQETIETRSSPAKRAAKNQFVNEPVDTDQPALIILCTWLGGASAKRIQRYTMGYHRLWPLSTILLIRTTAAEYAFSGAKALRDKLGPARREIRRIMDAGHAGLQPWPERGTSCVRSEILLHMFSNGGANMATQLVASMNAMLTVIGKSEPLPLRQVVLDSCPGELGVKRTFDAAAHSIPTSHPLRPLFCAALYLVVAGIAGLEAAGVRRPMGKTIRAQLNDLSVFSPSAGRLYLVSTADTIVETRDVYSHRAQAAARGLRTEMVVFQRAGHCSLLVEDETVYWSAIESSWRRDRGEWEEAANANANEEQDTEKPSHGPHAGLETSGRRLADLAFHVRSRL